ncbi:MAG: hypothetical protein KF861_02840 [Planctomycetaceae bacterium]|nr:hypothetical protein [Planctomycetaceae bacterium]
MAKRLWLLILLCTAGCTTNLGSPDAPQRFAREVQDQFEEQIAAIMLDETLSDDEKERESARIERERASFEAYNRGQR